MLPLQHKVRRWRPKLAAKSPRVYLFIIRVWLLVLVPGTTSVAAPSPNNPTSSSSSDFNTPTIIGTITGVAAVLVAVFFGVTSMKYRTKTRRLGQQPSISGYGSYLIHGGNIQIIQAPEVTHLNIYNHVSIRYDTPAYFSGKNLNYSS